MIVLSPIAKILSGGAAIATIFSLLSHFAGYYSRYLARNYDEFFQQHARSLLGKLTTISRQSVEPFTRFAFKSKVFKNRIIKAATYEALCDRKGIPLPELVTFHSKMAAGGCGMSIVAYGAVSAEGRSFPAQLICRDQSIPMLTKLTSAIHEHDCLACIQITHAGYFSDRSLSELSPYHEQMSAQAIFNPAAFTFCRAMTTSDQEKICADFVNAARVAIRSGFDCLEIHCGHGYLLSQFLSPKLNPKQDLNQRLSFPLKVLRSIRNAIDTDGIPCLLMIKLNLSDGMQDGLSLEESAIIAIEFAKCGVDIIGLSGGLILENGLFMLRGEVPLWNMISATTDTFKRIAMFLFGNILIPQFHYEERYFQDPALYVAKRVQEWTNETQEKRTRTRIKTEDKDKSKVTGDTATRDDGDVKICYMGGVQSFDSLRILTEVHGFDFLQSGRAILYDAEIVNRWEKEWRRMVEARKSTTGSGEEGGSRGEGEVSKLDMSLNSRCSRCNQCIVDATMKQKPISCVEW